MALEFILFLKKKEENRKVETFAKAKRDLKIVQNILRSGRQEKKDEKYVFPSSFSPFYFILSFYLRINSINFNLFLYGILFTLENFPPSQQNKTIFHFFSCCLKIPKEFCYWLLRKAGKTLFFCHKQCCEWHSRIIEFCKEKNCSFKDIGI